MVDYVCNSLPEYLSRPLKSIQSVNRSIRSRNWSTPTPVHIPGASSVAVTLWRTRTKLFENCALTHEGTVNAFSYCLARYTRLLTAARVAVGTLLLLLACWRLGM